MAKQIQALDLTLTAEEEATAERVFETLKGNAEQQLRNMARSMAAKQPHELLGRGEFELREMLHDLGANILQTAINEAAGRNKSASNPAATEQHDATEKKGARTRALA